jgi:meso-butanediol dehydrogenase/(S,S)-butanediol dehydrogenase/diacetyl reductase
MTLLNSKAAIVTGGAQGIGLGIAHELAVAGCRVIIADRNAEKARAAVDTLMQSKHEVLALPLDVTVEKSVHECIEVSIRWCSRVDILVNNAGIHCESPGKPSTPEHFNRCIDVNLIGAWRMSDALIPHFKAQGGGRIINIASINGRRPWADTPAYSASKAALINLTQSQAITLGEHNINVNAVCPGGVMTAMADQFTSARARFQEEIIRPRVLKRALLPADIGHAVVFFASLGSRNITGQALNVDGGELMS